MRSCLVSGQLYFKIGVTLIQSEGRLPCQTTILNNVQKILATSNNSITLFFAIPFSMINTLSFKMNMVTKFHSSQVGFLKNQVYVVLLHEYGEHTQYKHISHPSTFLLLLLFGQILLNIHVFRSTPLSAVPGLKNLITLIW